MIRTMLTLLAVVMLMTSNISSSDSLIYSLQETIHSAVVVAYDRGRQDEKYASRKSYHAFKDGEDFYRAYFVEVVKP